MEIGVIFHACKPKDVNIQVWHIALLILELRNVIL